MSWIIIPQGLATAYRKVIFVWHTGIDAVELADGKYTLNERVLSIVEKYNKGLSQALSQFPTDDNPEFKEYEI
jgi:hypothetical protein